MGDAGGRDLVGPPRFPSFAFCRNRRFPLAGLGRAGIPEQKTAPSPADPGIPRATPDPVAAPAHPGRAADDK